MRKISLMLLFCFCLAAGSAAADEPLKLLVFPLSGSRDGIGAWAGEGIALSLSGQLTDADINLVTRGEIEDLFTENGLPVGVPLSLGSMVYIAEQADVNFVVMGSLAENDDGLKLSVRLLDMKTMKQGNIFTVSGTLATLPDMENELAWMIYSSVARPPALSREKFRERARRIPNSAYADYIESINEPGESRRIQLLEKAVREYADFAEAHFQMGRIYYQKRDYARALTHIEYGRKLPDERLQSEFMIGTCRLQLGQTAQAVEDYTRLLSLNRHVAALNNLAVAHIRGGDNILALRALTEAHAQERGDPAIAVNLAIARYLAGNTPAAMESVEEAVRIYPGNGMLYFLSSFLMEEAGNAARASADMAQAARFGVDVDSLLRQEPQTWMRVILNWINEE